MFLKKLMCILHDGQRYRHLCFKYVSRNMLTDDRYAINKIDNSFSFIASLVIRLKVKEHVYLDDCLS